MLKNENAIALIRAIDVAYSDPEVRAIPELQQALAKAAQDLDCVADHHQVASRLNQLHQVKWPFICHSSGLPKRARCH